MTMLKGVIAAAATPILRDLSIDIERLIEHCGWLLERGCDAINLLGTTGEATSFGAAERLSAMRAVAESGLPLDRFMVGTGASAFEDAVTLTGEARRLGFAGALLLPPFYYKGIEDEALKDFVSAVIKGAGDDGLRLYLYHFPANTGLPYSVDLVEALHKRHPGVVVGLKDSSGNLDYSAEIARRIPGFDVFPSAEASLGRAEELGFAGCISATANLTSKFAQTAWSGAPEARAAALEAAVEIRAAVSQFPLVPAVKASLSMIKSEGSWLRTIPPLTRLSNLQLDGLRAALSLTKLGAAL